jgi:preprotein translocase subunit SecD
VAPPAGQIRPARYLAAFVAVVAVLYALVFLTGDRKPTPKLGIDLQGGTRVTLTARTEDGSAPTRDQLVQAKEIIDRRVNGIGVSGAEVVQDGNNLVITVPGNQGEQAKSLGQTAKLRFRKVIGSAPVQQLPQPSTTTAPPSGTTTPQPSDTSAPAATQTTAPSPQGRPSPAQPAQLAQPAQSAQQPPAPAPGTSAPTTSPSTPTTTLEAPQGPADPEAAAEIQKLRETRQSTDPNVQQQALAALDCSAKDPLLGFDDPNLPLVTCAQDDSEKFVLEPQFLDGQLISNASAGPNPQGAGYVVSLDFDDEGTKTWGDFTSKNVQERAAFVLDGEVVSAPNVNEPILGGTTEISGRFNQRTATELANVLKYGSLPLSFENSEAVTVSATLGLASLQAGLIAGGIGLVLVMFYCLFYYRALGILTILSLVLSGVVVYAVLILLGRWIGFTLDLAGVAGFIIAIGITADSFVIFFERLKDEIREGRTFRSAVPRGWVRARLAVGQVKGFAFTLGMSTVLDLVVVFLVTYPLVAVASRNRFLSKPGLSGLGAVQRLAQRQRAAGVGTVTKEA